MEEWASPKSSGIRLKNGVRQLIRPCESFPYRAMHNDISGLTCQVCATASFLDRNDQDSQMGGWFSGKREILVAQ